MFEPRQETLDALMAKFQRINYERGHLPRVAYRLKRYRGVQRFSPEVWARIQARYHGYLQAARERGKNLSKPCHRQPYLMLAIRYELSDRDKRLRDYAKVKRTQHQKRYLYNVMSRRARMRREGKENGQRSDDRT